MIGIKQKFEVKNLKLRDMERTLTSRENIKEITGWNKSACEIDKISTGKNIAILIIRNIKLKKYKFITMGASNKDVTAINQDISEHRYHFEYIMEVSKDELKNKTVAAIIKDYKAGNTPKSLALLVGTALCAKSHDIILVDKMNVGVKTDVEQPIPNVMMTKEWEKPDSSSPEGVELDSFGRAGKLKLIHVIAATEEESVFINGMDDTGLTAMTCISMFLNGYSEYYSERECFNFANILPMSKLSNTDIKELKLKKEKDSGLPIINNLSDFDAFLKKAYA